MNDPQNLQDLRHLEDLVHNMQWETVTLEPAAEQVRTIDQQLPDAWLGELNVEYDRDVLDIPPGDINTNARNAIHELGIDLEAIMRDIESHEISLDAPEMPPLDHGSNQSDDFDR
jgi:hypothetical protein